MGFMNEHGSEIILIFALMGSFSVALTAMTYIPAPYGNVVGGVLYFTVLLLVFGLGKWSTQLKYSPYPHYHCIVLPELDEFDIFANPENTTYKINNGGESGTIKFNLQFPQQVMRLGKKNYVIIHYKGKWFERTLLRARLISISGFAFTHPQSTIIILKPVPNGGLFVDHGEEWPCFELVTGNRDKEQTYDLYAQTEIKRQGDSIQSLTPQIQQKLVSLEAENTDLRNRNQEIQQKNNFFEEYIRQQRATLRGVLEGAANLKAAALELIHPMYMAEITLDRLHKRLQGNKMEGIWPWIAVIVGAVLVTAYLAYHPEVITVIHETLNNPLWIAGLVIAFIAAFYIVWRWRKK